MAGRQEDRKTEWRNGRMTESQDCGMIGGYVEGLVGGEAGRVLVLTGG